MTAGSIASKAQQQAAGNAVVKAATAPTLTQYVNRMQGEIAKALPSVMTPERFSRIVLSTLSTNDKLQKCTPSSFLGAMMTAAQLGVEPNTPLGQAYMIPYGNQCQFQLGYKGMIDLAYRSGNVASIGAYAVYEHDEFVYELGIEPTITHRPAMKDRGNVVAFYAVWRGKDGSYGFEVMSKEDIDAHRKRYSKAYNSPWDTAYEEMAKKTVLKKCLKYAPLSTEFVRAVSQDETIHDTISDDMTLEPITMAEVVQAEGSVSAGDDQS